MSHFGLGLIGGLPAGNDVFTKILLHMDGANGGTTFPDSNAFGLSHPWTAHSAVTDTGTFKFGTASCNVGSTGWIDTPDSADFTLGSGDFTVDFWFNRQGGNGTARFCFGQQNSAGTVWSMIGLLTVGNVFQVSFNNAGAIIIGTTAITTAGWHHLAVTRSGVTARMFVDGVQEGGNVALGAVNDSPETFSVGRSGANASNTWNGFIDEFRLSVGIARWVANFTPPAAPYA